MAAVTILQTGSGEAVCPETMRGIKFLRDAGLWPDWSPSSRMSADDLLLMEPPIEGQEVEPDKSGVVISIPEDEPEETSEEASEASESSEESEESEESEAPLELGTTFLEVPEQYVDQVLDTLEAEYPDISEAPIDGMWVVAEFSYDEPASTARTRVAPKLTRARNLGLAAVPGLKLNPTLTDSGYLPVVDDARALWADEDHWTDRAAWVTEFSALTLAEDPRLYLDFIVHGDPAGEAPASGDGNEIYPVMAAMVPLQAAIMDNGLDLVHGRASTFRFSPQIFSLSTGGNITLLDEEVYRVSQSLKDDGNLASVDAALWANYLGNAYSGWAILNVTWRPIIDVFWLKTIASAYFDVFRDTYLLQQYTLVADPDTAFHASQAQNQIFTPEWFANTAIE